QDSGNRRLHFWCACVVRARALHGKVSLRRTSQTADQATTTPTPTDMGTVNGLLKTWCLALDRAGFEHAAGSEFIEDARPQLFECAFSGHWPERTSFAAASMESLTVGNHGAAGIVRASAASSARHHVS